MTANEQLDLDNDQRLNIHMTRLIIRHRSDVVADQELTDDQGTRRRIIGRSELGRMRHIELSSGGDTVIGDNNWHWGMLFVGAVLALIITAWVAG